MSNFKSLFNSTEYINNQDFYLQNDNLITCCICHGFLVNPLECLKCQTAFCKDCLNSWGDNNKTNPLCPFRCGGKNFTKPHKNTLQQLDKLIIKCFKCSKLVNYNKIESHIEKDCDKIMIECPNQGCTEKMTKALLEEHSLICDYGNTECEECGHTTIRKNKIKLIEMSRKKIYEKNKELGMFCREISELKDKIEEVEKDRQKLRKNSEKYKGEIEILNKKSEDLNKKNQNPKNNKEIIKMNENLKISNESLLKETDNLKKRYEILFKSILGKKWYAKLYQRNINGQLKDKAKGYVTLKKEVLVNI